MKRIKVSSSAIASVGYSQKTKTLEIEFTHGGVFQYFEVPKSVYTKLVNADSIGRYFLYEIKGSYEVRPV